MANATVINVGGQDYDVKDYTARRIAYNLQDLYDHIFHIVENLKDGATLATGFYGPSGTHSSSSDWRNFNFNVTPGEKYSFAGGRIMTCYYTSNAAVVVGGADSANRVETVPATAASVTVSFLYADIDDIAVVKSDTIVTIDVVGKVYPTENLMVADKETQTMMDKVAFNRVNYRETEMLSNGYTGPNGSSSSSSDWRRFDIPVKAGEYYSLSGGRIMTCYYNSSSGVVEGGADSANRIEKVPNTATTLRVSFQYANISNIAVTKSSVIVYVGETDGLYPGEEYQVYNRQEIDDRVPNVIYLWANPSNFRSVLESITDSSSRKHYVILLESGTYDVWNMFTSTEKADADFRGLWVPKFTKLYGAEKNVVFTCNATSQKSKLSTINLDVTASIENCKVTATYCRYAIHDDWTDIKWYGDTSIPDYWTGAFRKGFVRVCRNVETEITNSYVGASWGCGTVNSAVWVYENCKFGLANGENSFGYICHNDNSSTKGADITFINCRNTGGYIRLSSLNLNQKAPCHAHFYGNSASAVYLTEENASVYDPGIRWHVDGYGNTFGNSDVIIENTDSVDYSSNVDLI